MNKWNINQSKKEYTLLKSVRKSTRMCAPTSMCIYLYNFISEPIVRFKLCFCISPYKTKDRNMVVSESDFFVCTGNLGQVP